MNSPDSLPLVPIAPAGPPALAGPDALLAAFLAGRSPRTLRAYSGDLEAFSRWARASSVREALGQLLAGGQGPANAAALAWRGHMLEAGLSPATVNRRLAALRSLVKLARTLGQVEWGLDVGNVRSEAYRDTRGPGADGVRRLFGALARRADAKGIRDLALLSLLYHCGCRRAEVVALDLADVDLKDSAVWILGKGRRERQRITLPGATREALGVWLRVRETLTLPVANVAVFVALDPASKGKRLSGAGVYQLVRGLGERAGVRARPHGLRHAAITRALDLGMDVRQVQRFSRHADIRTLGKYDDNRQDLGGDVARQLAGEEMGVSAIRPMW